MASQNTQEISIDNRQADGFLRFFHGLPEKPATTIRIFNRTEYYTVHGADALFAAKEIFKTTATVKHIGPANNKLESLALSRVNYEHFIRDLLLVKQYRVEVYAGGGKTSNDWYIELKASPGNLSDFEDLLFNNAEVAIGSAVLGLKLGVDGKNKMVGIACVDAGQRKLIVSEFIDNDVFSTLESILVQLGPKECVLPAGSGDAGNDYKIIKKVLERNNVVFTERKRAEFAIESVKESLVKDLTRLLQFEKDQKEDAATIPQLNLPLAMSSLNATIKYLELLTDDRNMGQFTISTFDSSQFVHLDFAAVRALQVFPVAGSQGQLPSSSSCDSLYSLFSRCIRTPAGHRLLRSWLSQPLKDINHIAQRHDIVEALVVGEDGANLRRSMSEVHLRRVPDFAVLARKFRREKATLQDCYRIYQSLIRLPQLKEAIEKDCDSISMHSMFGTPLGELLGLLERFKEMVETTIDLQKAEEGDIMVKAEFDEALQELMSRMDELTDEMKGMVIRTARDLSLEPNKGLKLESNSQYGYFFRVTLKDEKLLRNNRAYTVLDSNKAGVRFQNEKLRRANDDYVAAREEYTQQQKAVVAEIIKIAVGYADTMQSLGDLIASLDVLVAFACISAAAPTPYVRPKMHPFSSNSSGEDDGIISLKQARHPCLEMSNSVAFIPNDVLFERGKSTFHIITGPNMGGKSTFLRTVGLSCLMAQVGCFVPCSSAEMNVVDAIMCRVGAGDCQARGISTFMAEMLETSAILRAATAGTLILIDELGRGTSTFDGYGLAWAISEHIAQEIGAFTLFATHFHELTALADLYPSVVNEHVTAHINEGEDGEEGTLTLLYAVKPGVCDQSFGIHVAKIAGIPDHVIEFAKLKQAELEDIDVIGSDKKNATADHRKIKKDGERLIEKFLNDVQELKKRSLKDEELAKAFACLKEEIKSSGNPYIEGILKSVTA